MLEISISIPFDFPSGISGIFVWMPCISEIQEFSDFPAGNFSRKVSVPVASVRNLETDRQSHVWRTATVKAWCGLTELKKCSFWENWMNTQVHTYCALLHFLQLISSLKFEHFFSGLGSQEHALSFNDNQHRFFRQQVRQNHYVCKETTANCHPLWLC